MFTVSAEEGQRAYKACSSFLHCAHAAVNSGPFGCICFNVAQMKGRMKTIWIKIRIKEREG